MSGWQKGRKELREEKKSWETHLRYVAPSRLLEFIGILIPFVTVVKVNIPTAISTPSTTSMVIHPTVSPHPASPPPAVSWRCVKVSPGPLPSSQILFLMLERAWGGRGG